MRSIVLYTIIGFILVISSHWHWTILVMSGVTIVIKVVRRVLLSTAVKISSILIRSPRMLPVVMNMNNSVMMVMMVIVVVWVVLVVIRWLIIMVIMIDMVWFMIVFEVVSLIAVFTVVTVISMDVISRFCELILVKIVGFTGSISDLKWCWATALRASFRLFES